MTLVILAAGMGSRFGGLKQLTPLTKEGEFIIDFTVYDAICAGFDKIVFIIKKENLELFEETIGSRLKRNGVNYTYVFQSNELPEGFTVYPQVLKNVRVADKAVAQADPDVQAAVSDIAGKLGDTGRILVRESGTEPVIRVMVEAESKELCEQCVDFVVDVIRRKGHTV